MHTHVLSTGMSSPPHQIDRLTGRAWGILFVLCGAVFLEGVDVSMLGVALPAIRADLDMSTSALQWVVSAYVLGYGGFVLLGGRAADLLGRRRMFLLALGVFIAFSGLGGLASEGWMLILARFVTGVSAGFMTPAALSIITTTFAEGPTRNRALLVYGAAGAAGFSLGLVVGGALTEIDWRWVFFAPVIAASVILAFALRFVPRGAPPPLRTAGGFDLPGALSITGAMLLLVFAVVRAPDVGWGATIPTLAAAAVLLAAFVAIERRSPAPLVRFGILRSAPLLRANLGAMLFIGAFMSFQFVLVLYLQELRGWSALETGLALLVAGIDAFIAPTLTPRLVSRFGTVRGHARGHADRGAGVRAVPAARRGLDLREPAALDDPARARVLARLRRADDLGHRRHRRGGAGAGRRPAQRVAAVRRGVRPGGRDRGQRGGDRVGLSGRAARRLPHGARRPGRGGGARRARHRVRPAAAARDRERGGGIGSLD